MHIFLAKPKKIKIKMKTHHFYTYKYLWYLLFAAIGGEMGWLLEQNAQAFNQISANFAASKVN